MENDFRKLWLIASVVTMLVCIANAKGQELKVKKDDIKSTITNIDILYPPDASQPIDMCFVFSKEIDIDGNKSNEYKKGELLDILPLKSCLDENRGIQTEIFLFQVVTVRKNQVIKIKQDKESITAKKKIYMDTTDLTKTQREDLNGKVKVEKGLGNWRLKVQ